MGLVAGYAELRGEVAYRMSGPATAANKYEVPPHDAPMVGPAPARTQEVGRHVPGSETIVSATVAGAGFATLGA
jgi:hypothetical protein